MKFLTVPALMTAFLGIAISLRGQDAKADLDKLQGEWAVTAMERKEKLAPAKAIENLVIIFKDDKMIMTRKVEGAKNKEYAIKLHPAKKPAAIDLMPQEGAGKGMKVRGIYQFDGKNLKLCISNTVENERPEEFKAPADSDLIVLSLTPAKK
ncbi:MAG: TIGR03067 domain-containing protein [Planctomycetes bacterium]|nr:TIGR03067 domain-containing protein [Planctomycetota bacterium]